MSEGRNVAEAIQRSLAEAPASLSYVFHDARLGTETVEAAQMGRRIASVAAALDRAGIPPRSVVPIVASSSARLWATFVGAIAADLIPCIMTAPTFKTHVPTWLRNTTTLMTRYESSTLLVEAAYRPRLGPVLAESFPGIAMLDVESLDAPVAGPAWAPCTPRRRGNEIAFLQHSSGSTGTPKGVALSHAAVLGHLEAYAAAIRLDPASDRICSWLPLYHDMGLITSFLFPLVYGVPCDTLPPQDWILDPQRVLSLITERRSTLAWWPNFTFSLLAQRVDQARLASYDLGSLRLLINCSEPVLPHSRDAFLRAFQACGVRGEMLHNCYAMAENVYAISQSLGAAPRELTVRRDSLEAGRRIELCAAGETDAKRVMSSGRLIDTVRLRVVDEERRECDEGQVGILAISGASLFSGYHRLPEATAPVLHDGWYFTGDLGFVREGEVFVLGRQSDLIVVGGRKFYANDLEHVVTSLEGVKEGRTVAFGVLSEEKGTQEVVVLAESVHHEDRTRAQAIRRQIKQRVLQETDCAVDHAVVVAPNSLIKTSSGKIARHDNRRAYLERHRAEV